ncbi:hypothetical protein CEXT_377911, partial [Caerostris extrusa]
MATPFLCQATPEFHCHKASAKELLSCTTWTSNGVNHA